MGCAASLSAENGPGAFTDLKGSVVKEVPRKEEVVEKKRKKKLVKKKKKKKKKKTVVVESPQAAKVNLAGSRLGSSVKDSVRTHSSKKFTELTNDARKASVSSSGSGSVRSGKKYLTQAKIMLTEQWMTGTKYENLPDPDDSLSDLSFDDATEGSAASPPATDNVEPHNVFADISLTNGNTAENSLIPRYGTATSDVGSTDSKE